MKPLLLLVLILGLAGCADGSALMTGQARPPIADFNIVTILTEMPDGAEQIAIVKASSKGGWNQQDRLDYAVEELKKQAAKVGANAVVLTGRDTSSQVVAMPVYGGGTQVTSSESEIVQGVAVWVD